MTTLVRLQISDPSFVSADNLDGWHFEVGPEPRGFTRRLWDFIDKHRPVIERAQARGVILWDGEGARHHARLGFAGDTTMIREAVWSMLNRLRETGLDVGVCIRPQAIVRRHDGTLFQVEPWNVVRHLSEMIDVAVAECGARLFYIDSNIDERAERAPMSFRVLQGVRQSHPDVELIPEHEYEAYRLFSTPYRDAADRPRTGAPGGEVIFIERMRQPTPQQIKALREDVGAGSTLMVHADEAGPGFAVMKELTR